MGETTIEEQLKFIVETAGKLQPFQLGELSRGAKLVVRGLAAIAGACVDPKITDLYNGVVRYAMAIARAVGGAPAPFPGAETFDGTEELFYPMTMPSQMPKKRAKRRATKKSRRRV